MASSSAVTLIALAAGRSTRFGRPKQLEPVMPDGRTILDLTVADAAEAGCSSAPCSRRSPWCTPRRACAWPWPAPRGPWPSCRRRGRAGRRSPRRRAGPARPGAPARAAPRR
ncbi:MAG: NTP transferase domain-containing protein [Flavobacteriales bacterium]|nr:NTP transferase domain-containing protein [Flavobacteriales bacterium]MCL4281288.1 NTP transferase domain-containing protein [Flavobacteriales bacterium]